MRALTLTQPWAGLVASGLKLIENRPRRMVNPRDWGTPFAIHASRELDDDVYTRIAEIAPDVLQFNARGPVIPCKRDWYRLSRTTSAVIGVATIVTYVTDARQIVEYTSPDQPRWFFGPVGYVLRDVVALKTPVPCRGHQGFWTLPADVEAKVREQLGERAA